MAKKKKSVANPARGFATTSIASKPKIDKSVDETNVSNISQAESAGTTKTLAVPSENVEAVEHKPDSPSTNIHQLSPEELEEQLEKNDLQLMVEKHGAKVSKESFRQISRVQTDRRVLRGQAQDLYTREWLPEELMLQILELTKDDNFRGSYLDDHRNQSRSISEEDLVIKFWTLHRALSELGISPEYIRKVFQRLVVNRLSKESGGQLWGFPESLDLLALECEENELPAFNRRLQSTGHKSAGSSGLVTPTETPTSSIFNTPERSQTPINQGIPPVSSSATLPAPNPVDVEVSDLDSDLEPEELLSKYLSTRATLYEVSPDLYASGGKNGTKVSAVVSQSPGMMKLQKKLRQIESDVLFDKREADAQWIAKRNQLAQEGATRKKLQLHLPDLGAKDQKRPNGGSFGMTAADEVMNEAANVADLTVPSDAESDNDSLLGGMFAALPDESGDSQPSTGVSTETTANITVRDFGKSTGMSPRRVLEEACRARDPTVKLFYKQVSPTTYSARHSLTVVWSKQQDDLIYSPIPAVSCEWHPLSATFTMTSIAAVDTKQSEAYVSVVGLFVMFSSSPKEERAYLRLPSVWRDLWVKFLEFKKEQSDATDRELLKELRTMVHKQIEREAEEGVVLTKGLQNRNRNPDRSSDFAATKTLADTAKLAPDNLVNLWTQKSSMLPSRLNLPISDFRDTILSAIEQNQVIVLCGETGCGKSTQLPAYILENELAKGRGCKIYCTEPRRISAISLAQRVSEEHGEPKNSLGTPRSLVGYAIRLETRTSAQTRLVFATVGIVLRMLESPQGLEEITHLIIDEVHERSIDTDFLLIVVRSLMIKRPDLKVVVMSATLDAERFSRYLDNAPVIQVPGRTYPVQPYFLEDAIELTNHMVSENGRYEEEDGDDDMVEDRKAELVKQLQSYTPGTRNTLMTYDEYRIDYELIVELIKKIAYDPGFMEYSKAVLVFLPGLEHIRQLNDMLVGHPSFNQGWRIYPLHSTIATEDQQQAFLVPPQGIRKIVIATNIAETGITIPDITAVIDTGKHKEMRFDERRQLSRLLLSFISRANAKQRRGRAGRVQKGLCFHLFTKYRHDHLMSEQQTPELLRLSLQDLVMRVKTIPGTQSIEQTLSQALDPPPTKKVRLAIEALIEVGALTPAEELTPLGKQLSKLPLDAQLAKAALFGCVFGCADVAITIAALLSSRSPFIAPFGARQRADAAHLAFKKGDSDLLTAYNAYTAWRRVCQTKSESEFQFCQKNFLSSQNLSGIEDIKSQLLTSLIEAGFISLDDEQRTALSRYRHSYRQRSFVPVPASHNANNDNDLLINAVVAWAFYPKLLVRDGKGWRNVANNQSISLHPTSVNKGTTVAKYLSYYSIMQSSSKFYNAQSTSIAYDLPLLLLAGDADFRLHAGVIILDGNRLRFAVDEWKTMIALKTLRRRLKEIVENVLKDPGRPMNERARSWMDVVTKMFEREEGRSDAARPVRRL